MLTYPQPEEQSGGGTGTTMGDGSWEKAEGEERLLNGYPCLKSWGLSRKRRQGLKGKRETLT